MTRKDYVALADAIDSARHAADTMPGDAREYGTAAVLDCAQLIARVLEGDNERFQRARFMVACGFGPDDDEHVRRALAD